MNQLRGIVASPGLVDGPAFMLVASATPADAPGPAATLAASPAQEEARLSAALTAAAADLARLRSQVEAQAGASEAAIFEAHALILEDPDLLDRVRVGLVGRRLTAESAWSAAIEEFAAELEALGDEYLAARSADVRDVGRRVIRRLSGQAETDLSGLTIPSIILAADLTPSDTVRLDRRLVLGFCTAAGGPTSHTAILARALGLPALVALGPELLKVTHGAPLLLDAAHGLLTVDPDREALSGFVARREAATVRAAAELAAAGDPVSTLDGRRLEIAANIGSAADAIEALRCGAEGVGLFRTEFMFLDRSNAPGEEEQAAAYRSVLEALGGRPAVVRTLDAGGDKALPYLDLGREDNPFLGWRAIRICLDRPEFFKTQLRALLRAGAPGVRGAHDLRIMFPMIATVAEVRAARRLLDEARAEALSAGHPVAERIQVGIMIEIPAAALLADRLAPLVDFFSLGTNDLTQYTLAAERTNPRVAHLGDPCHPAVLRLIRSVIESGHTADRWVGVCGEMAGDPEAVPLLLGLGLDEFSMAPAAIPRVKAVLRTWSAASAARLASVALDLDSAEEARNLVRRWVQPA